MWQGLVIVLGTILFYIIGLLSGSDGRVPFVAAEYYSRSFDLPFIAFFLLTFWILVRFTWKQVRRYGNREFTWPVALNVRKISERSSGKWWDPARSWKEVSARLYFMLEWLFTLMAMLAGVFLGPITLLLLAALGRAKGALTKELFNGLELGLWLWFVAVLWALIFLGTDLGFWGSSLGIVFTALPVLLLVLLAYGLNGLVARFVPS
ncbi:hypothetical protein DRH29_02490 [candidate division Kazan bacterium]|uniref:Uncharacterized protein n=1 Tax=candidate division Kazan bacterium TaxID=2202143 RepID=A0A420ZCR7_UNCK3|nr:MAG: hypothetical protein DRH29_02490 [candidate division Kazan bacterium]